VASGCTIVQKCRQTRRRRPGRGRLPTYYAAFHAVSALFALQGKTFTKHRALEAAVHRDLVRTQMWAVDLGAAFSWLVRLRRTGDYGGSMHVSLDEAQEAVDKARQILRAVRTTSPEPLPQVEDEL
jgi:uncharacterized protein (UPF0332 family)